MMINLKFWRRKWRE